MADFITLFAAEMLPEGGMRRVVVEEEALVIVHQGGEWFALTDCCSHEAFKLSDGYLGPGKIHCSLHGSAFDLHSGEALSPPAYESIAAWQVRIRDGMVQVAIED
jgi:3-phenylpropionate/trans-cinnamate dioxygenase ferredoxin component